MKHGKTDNNCNLATIIIIKTNKMKRTKRKQSLEEKEEKEKVYQIQIK